MHLSLVLHLSPWEFNREQDELGIERTYPNLSCSDLESGHFGR